MKNKILMLLFVFFFLSLVTPAQSSLGIFKKNECIDLTQTCETCTYNNITSITYPNGTKYIFSPEQNMTHAGTEYTFKTCDFSGQLGDYKVNGHGDLDGVDTIWNYEYKVTASGHEITESQGFVSIGLLIGAVAVAFLFMIIGWRFSDSQWYPVSLFFMVIALLLSVYSLHLGYIYSESILSPLAVQGGQSAIFIGIMWGLVGIVLIGMTFFTIKVIKTALNQKAMRDYGESYNPKTKSYE